VTEYQLSPKIEGGNMRALFVSRNLIGDALYVGPALRAWIKKNPNSNVYLLTLNDHITPLYEGVGKDWIVASPGGQNARLHGDRGR
jgi:hypothetical protein